MFKMHNAHELEFSILDKILSILSVYTFSHVLYWFQITVLYIIFYIYIFFFNLLYFPQQSGCLEVDHKV